jgi:plasmid replication initiation protein
VEAATRASARRADTRTPYEILRFIGAATSLNDYLRLKAALDRLQSTTVATSHPRNHGKAIASLLVDQRVEGTADASGAAGHRTDPAGLVLCGRCSTPPWC